MLATAQRRAEELGVRNVRFKQIDAETSIDVEAASLDGVLCRWGYMLMADPESALRETRRVLKPGARVALAAWTGPDDNPWSVLPDARAERARRRRAGRSRLCRTSSRGRRRASWPSTSRRPGSPSTTSSRSTSRSTTARPPTGGTPSPTLSSRFAAILRQAGEEDLAAARAAVDRHAERFAAAEGTLRIPARTWVAWAAA